MTMYKHMFILTMLSLFLSQAVHAQEETEIQHFRKSFWKGLSIPREISHSGEANFFFILIKIEDGKIADTLSFSANTPGTIKSRIQALYPIFAGTRWEKVFPRIVGQKNASIMLPLYYYPISWSQQSHVSQFGSALNKAFDGIDMSSGYFILSPIVYEFSEPQKFRLKS